MKYPVLRQPMETTAPAAIARRQAPLETLKIEMAYLRVEDIKYLMHKFDSVSNLQVDLWGALYDEDPATETLDLNSIQSADTFRQFIEHLTRVPTFLITKIRLFNRHLRQTLTDLKKCFQVKHLTISNLVDTSDTTVFSIKSLSKSRDGQRRPIYLDLEIGSAELLSVAKLVYEVLSDDVVELQFGDGLIDHYDSDDERYPSHLQGEAVKLGINMLPFLKVLTATYAEIRSMKSIVNPKAPKLALDFLDLGSFTHLEALLQMSQRIKSIKRWVAPCHIDYDENMVRQNYVLNMPFTTFGEMEIDSESVGRFIVKLTTSSNTTFHGLGLGKEKQLPTEEDYYQEDDEDPENYGCEELMEAIGKVTIVCADVKKLKVGVKTIEIEN